MLKYKEYRIMIKINKKIEKNCLKSYRMKKWGIPNPDPLLSKDHTLRVHNRVYNYLSDNYFYTVTIMQIHDIE